MSQPNVSSGLIVIPPPSLLTPLACYFIATDTAGAATARRILPQRSRDSSSRPAKRRATPGDIRCWLSTSRQTERRGQARRT